MREYKSLGWRGGGDKDMGSAKSESLKIGRLRLLHVQEGRERIMTNNEENFASIGLQLTPPLFPIPRDRCQR